MNSLIQHYYFLDCVVTVVRSICKMPRPTYIITCNQRLGADKGLHEEDHQRHRGSNFVLVYFIITPCNCIIFQTFTQTRRRVAVLRTTYYLLPAVTHGNQPTFLMFLSGFGKIARRSQPQKVKINPPRWGDQGERLGNYLTGILNFKI